MGWGMGVLLVMGNQEKKEETLASSASVQIDIREIMQQLGICEDKLPYNFIAPSQKCEDPR